MPQREHFIFDAAHVAQPQHAIGNVERHIHIGIRDMRMHIPEAG
jgi:hypothetical protein